jgi:ribosomal protein S18 acetylase RimI-like enzyme
MDYLVRKAQPADARLLAVLATQVWLHTYATEGVSSSISEFVLNEITPDKYTALLQNSSALVLVAERNQNLLGFAVLQLETPCSNAPDATIELETLYVQAHFTGKRIGSALLTESQRMAEVLANSRLWLTVNVKNERAISFYSGHRYSKVGTHVFLLGDVGHDNDVLLGPHPILNKKPRRAKVLRGFWRKPGS